MPPNDPSDDKLKIMFIHKPDSVQELTASRTFDSSGTFESGVLLRVWAAVFPGTPTALPEHPWDGIPPEHTPKEGSHSDGGTRWTVPGLSGNGSCEFQTFLVWYLAAGDPLIRKESKLFRSHMPGSNCSETRSGPAHDTSPAPRYYRMTISGNVALPGSQELGEIGLIQKAGVVLEFSELSVVPFGRVWKCRNDTVLWMLMVPEVKAGQKTTAALFCQPLSRTLPPPFVWSGKDWQPMGVNRMVGASTGYGRPGEFPLEVVRAD